MASFSVNPNEIPGVNSLLSRNQPEALSILAAGTRVVGAMVSNGTIKIEGKVEGSVQAERRVVVGSTGCVEGDIDTHEATIGGRVKGSVLARSKAIMLSEGVLDGNVTAPVIRIDEGARIEGTIQTRRPAVPSTPPVKVRTVPAPKATERDLATPRARSSRDRSAV